MQTAPESPDATVSWHINEECELCFATDNMLHKCDRSCGLRGCGACILQCDTCFTWSCAECWNAEHCCNNSDLWPTDSDGDDDATTPRSSDHMAPTAPSASAPDDRNSSSKTVTKLMCHFVDLNASDQEECGPVEVYCV